MRCSVKKQKNIYEKPAAEFIIFSDKDILMNSKDEGWTGWYS